MYKSLLYFRQAQLVQKPLLAAVFRLGAKTKKMKKYIVVNIGCIECDVSSNIVGVFDNEEKANEIAKEFDEKFSWREGGQNSFEVFEMPELNVINTEYLETVA